MIFDGEIGKAEKLIKQTSLGDWSESYEPLGTLEIKYENFNQYIDYIRTLDLKNGIHCSSFKANGNFVEKESFCSYPDKIAAIKISAEKQIDFSVSASSKLKYNIISKANELFICGNAPDKSTPNYCHLAVWPVRYNEKKAMAFCAGIKIVTDGKIIAAENAFKISKSKSTVLYISTATGFNGFDKMPENSRKKVMKRVDDFLSRNFTYEKIKENHMKDFSSLMKRVVFELYPAEKEVSTNILISNAKSGKYSKNLAQLYYQYARYLTVSGSRKGTQALNLQGIWNNDVRPPWSSNYTTDINIEMNYWFTAAANLKECIEPYETLVRETAASGKKTADINYGCDGFCSNVNIDIWRKTTPVKRDPVYAYYPLGGLWMSNELFSLSQYDDSFELLQNNFDVFEEACKFALDWLVEYDGYLVTCPSSSPEVHYKNDSGIHSMTYATAFDMSIVWETLNVYITACEKLKIYHPVYEKAKSAISRLKPLGVDNSGLQEWHGGDKITEKGHRHFSPLYGLYPSNRIHYYNTDKDIVDGCKKLLQYRLENGSGQTGWSAAWAACLAARLHDGKTAYDCLKKLWNKSTHKNLFDKHPPTYFQIDGNFGGAAAIHEMLVQNYDGITELLPALPKEWANGKVAGLILKNGAEISFEWENGEVTAVKSDKPILILNKHLSQSVMLDDSVIIANEF